MLKQSFVLFGLGMRPLNYAQNSLNDWNKGGGFLFVGPSIDSVSCGASRKVGTISTLHFVAVLELQKESTLDWKSQSAVMKLQTVSTQLAFVCESCPAVTC